MLLYHQSAVTTTPRHQGTIVRSSYCHLTVILLASACCARTIIQIRNATCVFTCRGGPRTCGSGEVGCTLGACLPNRILSLKNSSLSMLVRYGAPCWSDWHDSGPAGRAMLSLLMLYCLSYGPVQSQPSLSACSG